VVGVPPDTPPWSDAARIRERTFAFELQEERITNAETGGEKGRKPERYDLIPWAAMDDVARVYAMGAAKYDDHNWRKGYAWSLSIGAAFRHLSAFAAGEDTDAESGESHLAHAAFHLLALLTFRDEHPELDDRPR
jgi:hypothetical protein